MNKYPKLLKYLLIILRIILNVWVILFKMWYEEIRDYFRKKKNEKYHLNQIEFNHDIACEGHVCGCLERTKQ